MGRKLGQKWCSPLEVWLFYVFDVWEHFNLMWPQQTAPVIVQMPAGLQENSTQDKLFHQN